MVRLVIEFDPRTGDVKVHGPLQNRMLCYGMLEFAREMLGRQGQQPQPGKIVVPTLIPPGDLR